MHKNKFTAILLSFMALTISGCFHEDSDVETVQYEFVHQTLTVLDRTQVILENIGHDLDASDVFDSMGSSDSATSSAFFKPGITNKSKPAIASELTKLADWRTGLGNLLEKAGANNPIVSMKNKVQARSFHITDNTTTDEFGLSEQDINEAFNTIFNMPTQEGDVITYTVKTELCDDEPTTTERVNCIEVLESLSVVFTVLSDTSGTVDIKIDNFTPLTYSYSSTRLSLSTDFNAVKQSAETFAHLFEFDNTTNPFPETFTGKLGIYVELLTSNSVEVGITVPEAINVEGDLDGEAVKLTLDASNKIFAIVADQSDSSVDLELGIGAFFAMFRDESNDLFEINVPQLTGILSVDILNESADITNFGVGASPITVDINNVRALELSIAKISGTLDGVAETFTLTSDLNVSLTVNNIHEDMNDIFDYSTDTSLGGTLSITAASGLVLSNPEADVVTDDVTRIDAGGPLTIMGSDYFLFNESVTTGECFVWDDDTAGFGSGFQSGDCTTWISSGL